MLNPISPRGGRAIASFVAVATLTSLALAHKDDPKPRDTQPAYDGPGYRAGQGGVAGGPIEDFDASGVTLWSWITVDEFAPVNDGGNDCWGYVSPSGREYALMGLSHGTGFVDITDPGNPVILDFISGPSSLWRDVKTYQEYAYVVTESQGQGSGDSNSPGSGPP